MNSMNTGNTSVIINAILKDILTCELCPTRFSVNNPGSIPKCLECSHSFCASCIEKRKNGMGMFTTVLCPACNVETTLGIGGVNGLNDNQSVLQLLCLMEALGIVVCQSCSRNSAKYICRTCPEHCRIFCASCMQIHRGDNHIVELIPVSFGKSEGQTDVSVISCPRSVVARLMNESGVFEQVRNNFCCDIELSRLANPEDVPQVAVCGSKNGVAEGRKLIECAISEFINGRKEQTGPKSTDSPEVTIAVAKSDARCFFDCRGNDISRLCQDNGCDIKLRPCEEDSLADSCLVISGGRSPNSRVYVRDEILRIFRECNTINQTKDVSRLPKPPMGNNSLYNADSTIEQSGLGSPPRVDSGLISEKVALPTEYYLKLLSTGRGQLYKIAERAGCIIHLSEDGDANGGIVTLQGQREQINDAKTMMMQLFDARSQPSQVQVPSLNVRENVGESAAKKPNIYPGQMAPPPINNNVVPPLTDVGFDMRGRDDFNYAQNSRDRIVTATLPCELENIGRLIGVKGARIMELREIIHCKISIHKGGNGVPCTVEIKGTERNVANAIPLVKMVIAGGGAAMNRIKENYLNQTLAAFATSTGSARSSSFSKNSDDASDIYDDMSDNNDFTPDYQNFGTSPPRAAVPQLPEVINQWAPADKSGFVDFNRNFSFSLDMYQQNTASSNQDNSFAPQKAVPQKKETVPNKLSSSASDDTTASSFSVSSIEKFLLPSPERDLALIDETMDLGPMDIESLAYNQNSIVNECALITGCRVFVDYWSSGMDFSGSNRAVLHVVGKTDQREHALAIITKYLRLRGSQYFTFEQAADFSRKIIKHEVDCQQNHISLLLGTDGSAIQNIQLKTSTRVLFNTHVPVGQSMRAVIIGCPTDIDAALISINQFIGGRQNYAGSDNSRRFNQQPSPSQPKIPQYVAAPPPAPPAPAQYDAFSGIGFVKRGPQSHNSSSSSLTSGRDRLSSSSSFRHQKLVDEQFESTGNSLFPVYSVDVDDEDALVVVSSDSDYMYESDPRRRDLNDDELRYSISNSRSGSHDDALGGDYQDPDCVEETIAFESHQLAQIIGKRGSILRELKRLSGCDIRVDPKSEPSSRELDPGFGGPPEMQIIHIRGSADKISSAKQLLNSVLEFGAVKALGMVTTYMDCPESKVPLVIGIRGLTSKEMMRRTGCKIHVNESVSTGGTCRIELTGTTSQIEQAQQIIALVLEHGTKALGKRFKKQQLQQSDEGVLSPSSLSLGFSPST